MSTTTEAARSGRWERKRVRTKTAIQGHALRLFREQGYQATTVDQVAEAADVAPSTVFRYFPAKHDLAVLADYFPLADAAREAFEAQPPELGSIGALREAIRAVFADLTPAERSARYERDLAWLAIPEVWAANVEIVTKSRSMVRDLIAGRCGRGPDDPAVRALADAVVGVSLGALLDSLHAPDVDPVEALDQALAHLEPGQSL
ncbi:TetR family transcriptional regulator [Murinocardiopsis flavida]|uniref:TetR family transcriptional regulator n=1 Tax=Murinocardiopsis flavida TaxID=645275 RepID=A0A2P8CXC7_9ACTN|nr:TetR family transcriptional regulator [Murinocardiopsis flavida]PSK89633.1 TetR family transcriptional regulator [Murinocardiopsis flavida]